MQVDNGFILLLEKEIFIDQLKDLVDKAEDMLNEDMEGERSSALTRSSQEGQLCEGLPGEVRSALGTAEAKNGSNHGWMLNKQPTESSPITLQGHQNGAPQPVYQQNGKKKCWI